MTHVRFGTYISVLFFRCEAVVLSEIMEMTDEELCAGCACGVDVEDEELLEAYEVYEAMGESDSSGLDLLADVCSGVPRASTPVSVRSTPPPSPAYSLVSSAEQVEPLTQQNESWFDRLMMTPESRAQTDAEEAAFQKGACASGLDDGTPHGVAELLDALTDTSFEYCSHGVEQQRGRGKKRVHPPEEEEEEEEEVPEINMHKVDGKHSSLFGLANNFYTVRVENAPTEDAGVAVRRARRSLQAIIDRAVEDVEADESDRIQLTVTGTGLNNHVTLPFLRTVDLTTDRLMRSIEYVMQSYTDFIMDGTMDVTVSHVRNPEGRGKKYEEKEAFLQAKYGDTEAWVRHMCQRHVLRKNYVAWGLNTMYEAAVQGKRFMEKCQGYTMGDADLLWKRVSGLQGCVCSLANKAGKLLETDVDHLAYLGQFVQDEWGVKLVVLDHSKKDAPLTLGIGDEAPLFFYKVEDKYYLCHVRLMRKTF